MKRIITFLLLMALTLSTYGQLKFEKYVLEDVVSAGTSSYQFSFPFVNEGAKAIEITKVDTTCSCTVAKLDKMVYAPNEKGVINGSFNIGSRTGLQEQAIIVKTNDISQPQITLQIKVNVKDSIDIKPRLLFWMKDSDLNSKIVTLNISDKTWQVEDIEYDNKKLKVRMSDDKTKIEVSPLSTKEPMRDLIKINLKGKDNKTRTFSVHALPKKILFFI